MSTFPARGAVLHLIFYDFIIWQAGQRRASVPAQRPAGTSLTLSQKDQQHKHSEKPDVNNKNRGEESFVENNLCSSELTCVCVIILWALGRTCFKSQPPNCYVFLTKKRSIPTSWHLQLYFPVLKFPLLLITCLTTCPTRWWFTKSNSDGSIPPKCHFRKWCLKRRALIISDSRDYRLAIKEPRRQKSLSSCRKKETFPLLTLNTYCNKGCVYLHLIHWHGRSARGPWCKYEALCRILTFSLTRWQISLCKRQRRTLTFCGISAYLVRSEVRYELLYVGTSR